MRSACRYRMVTVRSCVLAMQCDSQRTEKPRNEKRRPSAARSLLANGSP